MSITFCSGINDQCWNEKTIYTKLINLEVMNKKTRWIQRDLSTPSSSTIGRCFYSNMAKHFDCLKQGLYDIDLDVSQNILERLGLVVQDHQQLKGLFERAINNFESMTGRSVNVPWRIMSLPPMPPPQVIVQEKPVVTEEPIVITREIPVPETVFIPTPPIVVNPPIYVPPPVFVPPPVINRRVPFGGVRVIPGDAIPRTVRPIPSGPRVVPGTGHHGATTSNPAPRVVPDTGHRTVTTPASTARREPAGTRVHVAPGNTRRR